MAAGGATKPVARSPRRTAPADDRARRHAEAKRLRATQPDMTLKQIAAVTGLSERTVSRITGARPVAMRAARS